MRRGFTHSCSLLTTFPELPGLVLHQDFVSKDLQGKVYSEAKRISKLASSIANGKSSMVSPAHNIPIRSEYVPVKLPLEGLLVKPTASTGDQSSGRKHQDSYLSAEHFDSYGDGHKLTYYRGNNNIPKVALPNDFLSDILSTHPIIQEEVLASRHRLQRQQDSRVMKEEESSWKWRLTLNYFPLSTSDLTGAQGGAQDRVGFPWHRDLEANGAVTMILGLGPTAGMLEFGKEDPGTFDISKPPPKDNRVKRPDLVEPVRSIRLEPGSVLILTGPARWHYVHRVLPSKIGGERASLVFGVW